MPRTLRLLFVSLCLILSSQVVASAPEFPKAQSWSGRSTVVLPSGVWQRFVVVNREDTPTLAYLESDDDGCSWSEPYVCCPLPRGTWGGSAALIDRDGEVQIFFIRPRSEGDGKIPAVGRFLDMWHLRSTAGRTKWSEPKRIHAGYIGAISSAIQLKNGRIVMPFGDWVAGRERTAPIGAIETTVLYSDDNGENFTLSESRLSSPVSDDYNGDKVGACEPSIVELDDGRVLMFMRTQAGWLYESISSDGAHWPQATASILHSSTGPPSLLKLKDGRIFVAWNNCVMPPKVDGQGVYAGRDALHAAIADPQLKQWHGFREVYRDPTRNLEPPKRGDRGTAYPETLPMRDGRVAIVSGQGGRRALFYVDINWLTEAAQSEDFSTGLDGWCVFTPFGPAQGWWRNRKQGAELTAHPDRPAARVLHLRRADENDPDGAVWNFPSGTSGKLTLKFMLRSGCAGGSIALTDVFYDPIDSAGERNAMVQLPLSVGGKVGDAGIAADTWHTLAFDWDTTQAICHVSLDDAAAAAVPFSNQTRTGISYLRLRSTANAVDKTGWLIERVDVSVANP